MSFLAVALLGLKFSGTTLAIVAVVVIVGSVGVWYLATRRR